MVYICGRVVVQVQQPSQVHKAAEMKFAAFWVSKHARPLLGHLGVTQQTSFVRRCDARYTIEIPSNTVWVFVNVHTYVLIQSINVVEDSPSAFGRRIFPTFLHSTSRSGQVSPCMIKND